MTDKPISPLRQRMIEDMTARRFAEKIQNDYIRYVKNFAAFLGRSPDAATAEDLRLFQLHMAKTHVSPWTINATIVALRFFFKVTLERDDLVRRLTLVREPRRAPTVLAELTMRFKVRRPSRTPVLRGLCTPHQSPQPPRPSARPSYSRAI